MEIKLFGKKYKFHGVEWFNSLFDKGPSEEHLKKNHDDYSGIKLRLFASKDNQYVGDQLPVSGYCVKKIQVETDPNWYVFKTSTPLTIKGIKQSFFVIKPKEKNKTFVDDKIALYFMMPQKEGKLLQGAIFMNTLRYTGNVYSRPIIE